jgi:hypothetical protein
MENQASCIRRVSTVRLRAGSHRRFHCAFAIRPLCLVDAVRDIQFRRSPENTMPRWFSYNRNRFVQYLNELTCYTFTQKVCKILNLSLRTKQFKISTRDERLYNYIFRNCTFRQLNKKFRFKILKKKVYDSVAVAKTYNEPSLGQRCNFIFRH